MQLKPGVGMLRGRAQHAPQQCRCQPPVSRFASCRVQYRSTMLRLRPAAGGPAIVPQARSGRPLIATRPRALATSGGEKSTATSTRNAVSMCFGATATAAAHALPPAHNNSRLRPQHPRPLLTPLSCPL